MRGFKGLFLDSKSQEKIKKEAEKLDGFLDRWVFDMHVTFEYGDVREFPEWIEKEYEIKVIGFGKSDDNAGFEVILPESLEPEYKGADKRHITVSLSENGKAVNTAFLCFEPIEPFTVTAYPGIKLHNKKNNFILKGGNGNVK